MLKPAKMLGVFSPIRICHAGAHLLQAYISYRRVQLVGVRVLMFGRHTTVLGGMRWCVMVPPSGSLCEAACQMLDGARAIAG